MAKRSNRLVANEVTRQVAALKAAGASQRTIAEKVGRSRATVRYHEKRIEKNEELKKQMEEHQAKLGARSAAIAYKLLDKMDSSIDGVKVVVGKDDSGNAITEVLPPPLSHQAQALRELGTFVQRIAPGEDVERSMSVQFDARDPAVMQALAQALGLAASPVVDVTPVSEREG